MGKMRKREKARLRKEKNALRMRVKRMAKKDVIWVLESIISSATIKAERERIRKELERSNAEPDHKREKLLQKMELLREKRRASLQNFGEVEEYSLPQLRSRSKTCDFADGQNAVLERGELIVDLSQDQFWFHIRSDLPIFVPNEENSTLETNALGVYEAGTSQCDGGCCDEILPVQVNILQFHEF